MGLNDQQNENWVQLCEQEKLVAMNFPLGDFSSLIILILSMPDPPPEKSIQPNTNTDVKIKRMIFFICAQY